MQKINLFSPQYSWILIILVIWSLIWKGIALWKSARRDQSAWFVTLLILNTLGILEIIYIVFFTPKVAQDTADKQKQIETDSPKKIV